MTDERPPYATPPPCAFCGGSDYNDPRHGPNSWTRAVRGKEWVTLHFECHHKADSSGWFRVERRFQVAERARITSRERKHKGSGGQQDKPYDGPEG